MNEDEVEKEFLGLAVEDYYGPWEFLWRLNAMYPDLNSVPKEHAAEAALRELLDRHWLTVFRGTRFDGDERELTQDEIDVMKFTWTPPHASEHIRITATQEGNRAYYSGDSQGVVP